MVETGETVAAILTSRMDWSPSEGAGKILLMPDGKHLLFRMNKLSFALRPTNAQLPERRSVAGVPDEFSLVPRSKVDPKSDKFIFMATGKDTTLVVGNHHGVVVVVSWLGGKELRKPQQVADIANAYAANKDANMLAVAIEDSQVTDPNVIRPILILRDIETRTTVKTWSGPADWRPNSVALLSNSSIASVDGHLRLRVWDISQESPLKTFKLQEPTKQMIPLNSQSLLVTTESGRLVELEL